MASASSDLTAEDHLRICQEFVDLGAWLARERTDSVALGWAITQSYYAALHAVSAYFLARHGERAATHVERDRILRDRRFPEFGRQDRDDYFGLKSASENARYFGQEFTVLHEALWRQRALRLVAKWSERARKGSP